MKEVVIQIPELDSEQNIEIDVKINGKRKVLNYRVEIVNWDTINPSPEERISKLRRVIKEHDKDWQLMTIGAPTEKNIPVMYRKKIIDVEIPE